MEMRREKSETPWEQAKQSGHISSSSFSDALGWHCLQQEAYARPFTTESKDNVKVEGDSLSVVDSGHQLNVLSLTLNACNISCAGAECDINQYCAALTELDLAENNFSDWNEVGKILINMPKLTILNLSFNPLSSPPDDVAIGRCFKNKKLEKLCLNKTSISWSSLCSILSVCTHLKELQVSANDYTTIQVGHGQTYDSLLTVHLNANPISSWDEILTLGRYFPSLKVLQLAETNLDSFTASSLAALPQTFPKLNILNLNKTQISSWQTINQLTHFPFLGNLRIKGVPLVADKSDAEVRCQVIARLPLLTRLDGNSIYVNERVDAEKWFISTMWEEGVRSLRGERLRELEKRYINERSVEEERVVAEEKAKGTMEGGQEKVGIISGIIDDKLVPFRLGLGAEYHHMPASQSLSVPLQIEERRDENEERILGELRKEITAKAEKTQSNQELVKLYETQLALNTRKLEEKGAEIVALKDRIVQLKHEKDPESQHVMNLVTDMTQQLDASITKVEKLGDEVRQLEDEKDELRKVIEESVRARRDMEDANQTLRDKVTHMAETVKNLEEKLEKREQEAELARGQVKQVEQLLNMTRQSNDDLKEDVERRDEGMRVMREEIERGDEQKQRMSEEMQQIEEEMKRLRVVIQEKEGELGKLRGKKGMEQENATPAFSEDERHKEMRDLQEEKKRTEEEINGLREELGRVLAAGEELQWERQCREELETLVREKDNSIRQLQEELHNKIVNDIRASSEPDARRESVLDEKMAELTAEVQVLRQDTESRHAQLRDLDVMLNRKQKQIDELKVQLSLKDGKRLGKADVAASLDDPKRCVKCDLWEEKVKRLGLQLWEKDGDLAEQRLLRRSANLRLYQAAQENVAMSVDLCRLNISDHGAVENRSRQVRCMVEAREVYLRDYITEVLARENRQWPTLSPPSEDRCRQ